MRNLIPQERRTERIRHEEKKRIKRFYKVTSVKNLIDTVLLTLYWRRDAR